MPEQLFDSKKFLTDVSSQPGVYRMYNKKEEVIYVGKAKNLKKRLSSYFRANVNSVKTEKLVSQIANIEVTLTMSETEALLLEHNYIKRYKPRYNVLLRDDKSYPYILLSNDKHPRISMHRGSKKVKGELFGPYPNSSAVHETLSLLQKIFPIRQCSNTFYSHRSRPCLQYQIGRCSAPCVAGHVTDDEYNHQVNLVKLFLQGRDQQVLTQLVNKMEGASQNLEFEKAATIRDQIQSVRAVVEKQSIENQSQQDIDIIAILYELGIACIHVIFVRQGKVMGNRNYFPKLPAETEIEELTETFVGQFYLENKSGRSLPRKIILDQKLNNKVQLTELLSEQFQRKVIIQDHAKGSDLKFLNLAQLNARTALGLQVKSTGTVANRYKALKERLNLTDIKRMECFDISHTMGEQTIASCVVFNNAGPHKQEYRRYNIEGITPGDDYAAMEQVLTKRYSKAIDDEKIPDIIFIDGGKGQLGRAIDVFKQLDVSWDKHKPILIGVAKGVERKAGLETLIIAKSGKEIHLDADDSALHLIQHIRDESHRFAITGHRHKRGKQFTESGLESIPGIGAKRRQALLKYFGGMQGVKSAKVDELASVPGISKQLAEQIVEIFHQK